MILAHLVSICKRPPSPFPPPRALDKERLEGSSDQGAPAGRASTGGDPADASSGPQAPSAAAGASSSSGNSSVPAIFRTRPSARFGAPKPRPLYAKFEILLDLIYRRLYWDPSQPESTFSQDVLLRAIRKIDKDLGP